MNDQIVQYIFHPVQNAEIEFDKDLQPKEQETLKSSVGLIRRLLLDAQAKFRKMVEENKQLAAKIDGSICAANQEVSALRAELEDTNKRLTELSVSDIPVKENGVHEVESGNECKYYIDMEITLISLTLSQRTNFRLDQIERVCR